MRNNKTLIIIFILAVVIAGGFFIYSKIKIQPYAKMPGGLTSAPKPIFPQSIIDSDQYYNFSGRLTEIDTAKKLLTMRVDSVDSLTDDLSASYQNKIYNFQINDQTEIYRINIGANLSAKENKQIISLENLKAGDEVSLFVDKKETGKKDNFPVFRVVLIK